MHGAHRECWIAPHRGFGRRAHVVGEDSRVAALTVVESNWQDNVDPISWVESSAVERTSVHVRKVGTNRAVRVRLMVVHALEQQVVSGK